MNYQAISTPQLYPEENWPLLWEQIRAVFPPTRPSDEFRFNLKRELLLAAQQKQASPYPTPSREFLLFTALLGFLVSVAGLFFARRRHMVFVSP